MNYNNELNKTINELKKLIEDTKIRIYQTVNTEMVLLYWNIGKYIMELQDNKSRAKYGSKLLEDISKYLTNKYGKGFSKRNLELVRQFYNVYPIANTLYSQLTWSHYKELIKIKNKQERDFYMNECVNSNWDVRTLQRQRKSCLYERILLGNKNNNDYLPIETNKIMIKDPYILEFLNLKENYKEKDLEKEILSHLKEFMLYELGNNFSFVGSQVRIRIDDIDYYIDLVFYNRTLKCHLLIDLKVGKVTHRDIGQISAYVNYYDKYIKKKDENKTIGILLSTTKNQTAVNLVLPQIDNIYNSEYKTTLPSKEDLIRIIEEERQKYDEKVENFSEYL